MMAKKQFYRVNAETGETDDGFVAVVFPRGRNGFGNRWMAMSQEATRLLAEQRGLGLDGFRVLMWLLADMGFENHILVNQCDLARRLGMQRQNVSRAIQRLLDIEALEPGPKVGHQRSYRLNPRFGWRGSGKQHVKALDERMKRARITGVVS